MVAIVEANLKLDRTTYEVLQILGISLLESGKDSNPGIQQR